MQDEMKRIVKCPQCGQEEYYGMIHWRDGEQMCRKCIYTLWETKGPWRRTPSDMTFPIHEDGRDYTQTTTEKREIKSTEEIF